MMCIDFYSSNDMSLGQFLDKFCFANSKNEFKRAFLTSKLSFSHDTGRVIVRVKDLNEFKDTGDQLPPEGLLHEFSYRSVLQQIRSDEVLMWSRNMGACQTPELLSSEYSVVSRDVWNYSFGKLLEDMFYGKAMGIDCLRFPHLADEGYDRYDESSHSIPADFMVETEPPPNGGPVLGRAASAMGVFGHIASTMGALASKKALENFRLTQQAKKTDILGYLTLPKRLLEWHPSLPLGANKDTVLVNARQPTSVVAYSLFSKEYSQCISDNMRKEATRHALDGNSAENGAQVPVNNCTQSDATATMLRILRSTTRNNVDHSFVDDNQFQPAMRFSCKSYYAMQFHALRKLYYGGDRNYVESLCNCQQWNAAGGKSGAGFLKTRDERFIAKAIPEIELQMFLSMANEYFCYMAKTFENDLSSMLSKVLGIYKVSISNTTHNGDNDSNVRMCVIVMENLMYGREVDFTFDLKGKMEGRYKEDVNGENSTVLWDRNFVELAGGIPLPLQESALSLLLSAIMNDTSFLSTVQATDYSMLVGYDVKKQELVACIIDYIHKYDFMKMMEHASKRLIQEEGEITVLNPKHYRRRFCLAMSKYFVTIPSRYTKVTTVVRNTASNTTTGSVDDGRSVQQLETRAQPVLLDIGPEGQWKGSHLPPIFEQEVFIFDPMVFASIAIGKPAVAKPPTAQMLVFAYGAFQTYVPPTKSPEQIALEMEALSTRLLQTVMEMEQDQLQSDDELSLDALQRNAHQLFRMFDQDRSDSIDFEEYKQMLVYRKLNLLESKAKRFFELVDDQKNELQKRNVEGFSGVVAQKKGKRGMKEMQNALLDAIHQEEQNELRAALQAKEEVVRMEKQRRDAEQEETRRLFQQQRHAATSTRTKEALRERQEKMDRKKERTIKDRQSREERRLLERAEAEAEKRVIHEREVVQELMATKMERIIRHKARCGDDVMDLRDRGLKELPHDLYHGRDALTSFSNLLILDLSLTTS
ncbi:hypothetical protein BBO99_00003857 [Phytophthora kernoviae]|uniref:Uncharacterized protein n=2 Tax=Phytophthora kernoviae TaxID=325452 RepID=A0A3R7JZ51_9STRA|nr:hypothetical protein G195_004420 [Phytophthora kernoviae 00238/432]KAG2526661.1 hypothetical protein JM16_003590 [Phytophthora kernoviae]KAG2528356.1 hypothetical protein JM18_003296 [Phytophthora kernoviae]RLN37373.1 hypothetical protein BBI17_003986 [Phytophthora kernoviae]RLN81259.1 hypothetical protein BBO99_00003857 [Phytophthora kernoviae]